MPARVNVRANVEGRGIGQERANEMSERGPKSIEPDVYASEYTLSE